MTSSPTSSSSGDRRAASRPSAGRAWRSRSTRPGADTPARRRRRSAALDHRSTLTRGRVLAVPIPGGCDTAPMTSAQLGDVTIEYEVDGPDDGAPMLLVMGLGAQLVAWPTDVVEGLVDRGFRVIRMDNRDIGLSTKTEGPVPTRAALFKGFAHRRYARAEYLLSDMAADAVALLDHLDVEAAHVVGVSMGGMIAQQLTIDHPDRVLSLCSIMSNTGNRRHGSVSPRLLPTVAMSMSAPAPGGPRGGRAARRRGLPADRRAALRRRRDRRHGAHRHQPQRQPARHDPAAGRHPGQPRPHAGPARGARCRPWSSTGCATSWSCPAAASPRRGRCPARG